jgi:pimeloyl-ACP methyl ester carboxylesterase
VSAGDEVLLFGPGDDGEPTAQDWADLLGTIDYEIVTRIGARVPRVHREAGSRRRRSAARDRRGARVGRPSGTSSAGAGCAPTSRRPSPFFGLPAERTRTVRTEDGVALHVEEVGPPDADLTVVLVHGYVQEMAVWHYQRQALQAAGDVRVVLYDQRSHGRSSRGAAERSTIDQLGRDLGRVLDEVVPTGPVVLVGHSMGGMTVMALADGRPELFGDRVVGVALVCTSAGKLAQVTFGLPSLAMPVTRRVLPVLTRGMRRLPRPFERSRRAGSDLVFLFTRRGGFGSGDVSPAVVDFVATMGARTPVDVIAEFYDTFMTHDKLAALDVLRDVEVLVLAGDRDLMTPPDHSRDLAAALPGARLVVVEDAGHMVALEHPEQVSRELLRLLDDVRARRVAA